MRNYEAHILRNALSQLVAMAAPEQAEQAKIIQEFVLTTLCGEAEQAASTKQPRVKVGATIHVGSYGSVVFDDYTSAAYQLGISSASLQVRLSQHNGEYRIVRTDPETGEPLTLVVLRGKGGSTSERAEQVLHAMPAKGKRAKTLPEPERDEIGVVKTSRIRRFNPVENS